MSIASLLYQRVHIILQVSIAIIRNRQPITRIIRIQSIRHLPRIGDTIAIRIRRRRPALDDPHAAEAALVGDQRAGLAPRADLRDERRVDGVAGQRAAHAGEDDGDGVGGAVNGSGWRVGVRRGLEVDAGVAGGGLAESCAVEDAVAIGVVEVVLDVYDEMSVSVSELGRKLVLTGVEVRVAPSERRHACARSRYVIVVDDVGIAVTLAVPSDVAAAAAPVVHDLVRKLASGRGLTCPGLDGLTLFWKSLTPFTLGFRVLLSM